MKLHASCAARRRHGVLLLGPPASGKSDMLLRLLGAGFRLVADDRVEFEGTEAWPAIELAGLLEVRGLGIMKLDYVAPVRVVLAVELLGHDSPLFERLPGVRCEPRTRLPVVAIDAFLPSAVQKIGLALDCALGRSATL